MDYNTNYMDKSKQETEVERNKPWLNMNFVNRCIENNLDIWKSSSESLYNEIVNVKDIYEEIWDNIDVKSALMLNCRTWETLGEFESAKQYNFLTDTPNAMFHLTRIKQICTLLLLPKRVMYIYCYLDIIARNMNRYNIDFLPQVINSIEFPEEISTKEFLMNIKLLLLGTETKSFKYNNEVVKHVQSTINGIVNRFIIFLYFMI